MNADESRNAARNNLILTGPEQILENSKEFELDFINFDKHRLSNLTPENAANGGANEQFILQLTSNLDQDEVKQMTKEMERHAFINGGADFSNNQDNDFFNVNR